MLRFVVSASAVALLAGTAAAADLPPPVTVMPPAMVAPTPLSFNWSGFYLGGHGGYGFGNGAYNDGFQIGGQVGVNYQFAGGFVIGAEGDGSYVDWGGTNGIGTVRLRGGYAFDRFLAYATGGAAFDNDVGWVAGGGVEYALTDAWSVGVEFLHYDINNDSSNVIRGRVNFLFDGLAAL